MQQQVRDGLSLGLPAVPPPAVFNLHGKGEFNIPQLTAFQSNAFVLL